MQAKGPWVAFLDSDDEWNPDYLSSQYERIKEFPKAVAHMTNAFSVSLEMERIGLFTESNFLVKFGTKEYLVLEKPLALVIEHAMWFLQSSVMRRYSLLRAGLFDAGLSIAEDLDVIARMALEGPFTISKRELVEVFRRDEAIENLMAQSLKRGTYRHKAFGKVYDSLLSRGDLTRQEYTAIKRKQGQNLRALGNMLVLANRKAEARHSYMRSLLLHPSVRSLIKCVITYLPGNLSDTLVRKRKDILPGE
jgi:glycosyltransferase involved in cell wall biosynthesis